ERQDIAFVEFQRLDFGTPAPAQAAAPIAPQAIQEVASVTSTGITVPPPGDTRFRDRRLIVLYFDLTATPPADQMRAFQAALNYIDQRMAPADMMAIMTFDGGGVTVKQDFTGDRNVLREVVNVLIYGEDKDGDGIRDQPDQATA